jgi:hypothetical protein
MTLSKNIHVFLIQMIISNMQLSQPLYQYSLPFRYNQFKYIYVVKQQQTATDIADSNRHKQTATDSNRQQQTCVQILYHLQSGSLAFSQFPCTVL